MNCGDVFLLALSVVLVLAVLALVFSAGVNYGRIGYDKRRKL